MWCIPLILFPSCHPERSEGSEYISCCGLQILPPFGRLNDNMHTIKGVHQSVHPFNFINRPAYLTAEILNLKL